MQQKTENMLATLQCRYEDRHSRQVRVTATFTPGHWGYVDCTPLAVQANGGIANASTSKLLWRKLGQYRILSPTTETVTIDQDGTPNTVFSERASLAQLSEMYSSATEANGSHQSEYP